VISAQNPNQQKSTWSIIYHRYPSVFGGGIASFAKDLLNEGGWFGTGLARLEIEFVQMGNYVPSYQTNGSVVLDGSDGQSDRWEAYLASLPKRTFRRKQLVLQFKLRGDPRLDYQDKIYLQDIRREQIGIAAEMILNALRYAVATLKPSDDWDFAGLIEAAEHLVKRKWDSDEALRQDLTSAFAADRARMDAMDPWSKIDMTGFHRNARLILNEPSDWSETDDFSPHGNDLGADILHDWTRMKRLNAEAVAQHFEIDLTGKLASDSMDRIQLYLALALGHVKKTGTCPPDLAAMALNVLDLDLSAATGTFLEEHRTKWFDRIMRYANILQTILARTNESSSTSDTDEPSHSGFNL
jgi:uncharacterized protein YfeS